MLECILSTNCVQTCLRYFDYLNFAKCFNKECSDEDKIDKNLIKHMAYNSYFSKVCMDNNETISQ